MKKLTDKQQRFIEEYFKDFNATQAAIRAGYSPDTATEQGSRLLTNVKVLHEVERKKAEISAQTHIDKEFIIKNLLEVIDYCKANNKLESRAYFNAINLLAKSVKEFNDKIDCNVTGGTDNTITFKWATAEDDKE